MLMTHNPTPQTPINVPVGATLLLEEADYSHRYAMACDKVFRAIESMVYDREWDDEYQHTSDLARAVALRVFDALGVVRPEINLTREGSPCRPARK